MQRIARLVVLLVALAVLALAGCAGRSIGSGSDSDFHLTRNGNMVYATLQGVNVQAVAVNQEFKPNGDIRRGAAANGFAEGGVFESIYPDRIHLLIIVAVSTLQPEDPLAHPEEIGRGFTDIEGVQVPFSIQRSHDKLCVSFLLFVSKNRHLGIAYQESPMNPKRPDPERFPPMSQQLTREFMAALLYRAKFAFRLDPLALREHWQPTIPKPQT